MTSKAILFSMLTLISIAGIYLSQNNQKSFLSETLDQGFTDNFNQWLKDNGYGDYNFERSDLVKLNKPVYGGADSVPTKPSTHYPMIFIHGNSDVGVGDGGQEKFQTGFTKMILHLKYHGWTKAELYTTTWGTADANKASLNYHSKKYLTYLRKFVEAVLEYTKSEKVNIVSHSMGVTLARKVIKGGEAHDAIDGGYYNLGKPLTDRVQVFFGLAGGNEGLADCYTASYLPTCGVTNGFYPGQPAIFGKSSFLTELDDNPAKEGQWVVSIRTTFDQIIKYDNLVYGKYTTRIRGENQEVVYSNPEVDHFYLRDYSADDVLQLLREHGGVGPSSDY